MIKKILNLLLCMFLLAGCAGKNIIEKRDFSVVDYYHYELGSFYDDCDKMLEYANDGNVDQMLDLYKTLYNQVIEIIDLDSVSYVLYSEDVNNTNNKNENIYTEELQREMTNYFATTVHKITKTKANEDFKNFINNDNIYNGYADYIEKTDEILEIESKISELEKQYNEISDRIGKYSYTVDDVTYTYDFINSSDANYLYINNPDLYNEIYHNLIKQYNEETGNVYLQIIKLYDQIAKYYGYNNFSEYADVEIYGRDYEDDDLKYLKEYTKQYGDFILYCFYRYYDLNEIDINPDKFVSTVMKTLSKTSSLASETADIFINNKLYSISSGDGRYNGSFETPLYKNNSAFVFLNCQNTENDYFTLAHEFGHFSNSIVSSCVNPIVNGGCYDIFETHSTGLEMIFGLSAKSIFDDYDYINCHNVVDKLYSILMACIYDDWQRKVFAKPNSSLDEINDMFVETLIDYGYERLYKEVGWPDIDSVKYDWNYVPHNFNSPMYYISYGTSAFAALQIWDLSNKDLKSGVATWEKIVKDDAYYKGYLETIEDANLSLFTDEQCVSSLFESLYYYIIDTDEKLNY